VHGSRAEECVDGLTGLATSAVLQLRLSQVFDQCRALGISPEMAYTIVVVDADVAGLPPLVRDAAWVVLADHVWTVFSTGETVCRAGDRILVLAANAPELQDRIGHLAERLRDAHARWRVGDDLDRTAPRDRGTSTFPARPRG
jgi:GGDEF domain-containing protein